MISTEGSHCKKKGIVNTRPLRSFLMLVVLVGLGLMPAGGAQSLTILHQFGGVPANDGSEPLWMHLIQADRKSTRLNSSHLGISYAVFCLTKKKRNVTTPAEREATLACQATHDWL